MCIGITVCFLSIIYVILQTITDDVYWYYCIELAFYWSLLFSLSTDHKRKVTEHICTFKVCSIIWLPTIFSQSQPPVMFTGSINFWSRQINIKKLLQTYYLIWMFRIAQNSFIHMGSWLAKLQWSRSSLLV